MATVFRAWDQSLRVERAIKLFSPATVANPEARARIETEARAMASLRHAHVVGVHDIREEEGRIFIVMELVAGGTLWEWVTANGPLPPRLAVQAILAVLDAVGAAHDAGVVHRDLKPQNILLDAAGLPRVTDFGIARLLEADHPSLTRTGSTPGTWPFMSPEQRLDPRSSRPASDIYSLGATLFAVLTGQLPFDLFAAGEDASLLAGIQPDLAAVIRRATRFRAEERFPTARHFAVALAEVLPGLPALPVGLPPLGVRPGSCAPAGLPTADLCQDEPSVITNVDSAGPAADILYRRRRLLQALEDDATEPPRPSSGGWLWIAAAAPALMALIAGVVVMALDAPSRNVWARRTMALLGEASVQVRGDAVAVILEGPEGVQHGPGTLRPATYRVRVSYAAGEPPVDAGQVALSAGDVIDLVCVASERVCRAEPR